MNYRSDYNFELKHITGTANHADTLSQRPDYDDGSDDNEQIVALPDHLFLCQVTTASLLEHVSAAQNILAHQVKDLASHFPLESHNHHWWHMGRLVIVDNNDLKREVVSQYHDAPTAGHPSVTSTLFSVSQDYWWPKMRKFIQQYVRGCATCQANKADTTRPKPPLFPISPHHNAAPFSTIAVDWITKLPLS